MRRRGIIAAVVVVMAAGAFGLYWFAPWRLFTDSTVNEALPTVVPRATTSAAASTAASTPAAPTTAAPTNHLLAEGSLVTHEHETTGHAQLIRLADGRVQLTLRDLDTSDGPDLHVWLTDQPVKSGTDGWHVFDDGRYVELGELKANHGNQVYEVPPGTDINGLTSVTIWCKRFSVSFGAATLA